MRIRIAGLIAAIVVMTAFPIVGSTADLSINTYWADKAAIAGESAHISMGVSPVQAEIHFSAEGPSNTIEDNEGEVTIETIAGAGNLLTVMATASLEGEEIYENYVINLIQPLEPETNEAKQVVGTCDFDDADGVRVGVIKFTFDPSTVDNIALHEDGGPQRDAIVSTTRRITSMDGNLDILGSSVDFASFFVEKSIGTWYGDVDLSVLNASKPGSIREVGRGTQSKSEPGTWSGYSFQGVDASMVFNTATHGAAAGSWDYAEYDGGSGKGVKANGAFSCLLLSDDSGHDPEPPPDSEDPIKVISEYYGDKEMLEGAEGHITAFSDSVIPIFEHVSGASVQISVDPEKPYIAIVIPDVVSADTQSTIRIIAGNETINHTFKVVNQAEPEQAKGKTIAQCTFYHDYKSHTEVAGVGTFSFDKRTVHDFFIGVDELTYPPVKQIISTTRAIDEITFATGLTAFEENGHARTTQGLGNLQGAGIWYAGLGHQAGQIHSPRRGAGFYLEEKRWTTRDLDQVPYGDEHTDIWFSGENTYANDFATRGRWAVEFPDPNAFGEPPYDPIAYSEGYFECALADADEGIIADPEPTTDPKPPAGQEPTGDDPPPATESEPTVDGSEGNGEDTSVQSDQGSSGSGGGAFGYLLVLLLGHTQAIRRLLKTNSGSRGRPRKFSVKCTPINRYSEL